MSWYKIIKLAQIIEPASEFAFTNILERMYEAEYKYSMLKTHSFSGVEARKQNMLKLLENIMTGCIQDIRDVLINVFANWLNKHALLDPILWAKGREEDFEDESEKTSLEDALYEFSSYLLYDPNKLVKEKEGQFIKAISDNIDKIPSLLAFVETFKQKYINDYTNNIIEDGKRDKKNKREINKEIKEMENNTKQMTFYDIYNDFYISFNSFLEAFKDYFEDAKQLLIEIRAAIIFPLWFNKWKQKGIEKTRANVQSVYDSLLSLSPNQGHSAVATISIALNTAHQTGSMLEYVEELTGESSDNIRKILDNMTSGTNIPKWNEDLKKVGVQMDTSNQVQPKIKPEQIIKNPDKMIEVQPFPRSL